MLSPMKITERGGTRIVLPEGKGDKYKVRLMGWEEGATVVEGSSADYPIDRIKRDFPEAFPKGTRMRANHDGICEAGGDVRRIMAKTVDTPWAEKDGMYAHMLVPEGYAPFVENFGDVIGLSISAGCEIEKEAATDEDGEPILDHDGKPVLVPKRSERGAVIVSKFLSMEDSPYNAVDFVEAPGADGRIVARAVESAKQALEGFTIREAATFAKGTIKTQEEDSGATPPRSNKEEEDMDDAERRAIAKEAADAAVAAYAAEHAPSAPPSEQPTLEQTAESVVTAGLTEAGRKAVYERVNRGETLQSAIDAEKTRESGIEAEVERRLAERLESAPTSEGVFGFGYTEDDKSGPSLKTTESKNDAKTLAEREAEFEASFAEGV